MSIRRAAVCLCLAMACVALAGCELAMSPAARLARAERYLKDGKPSHAAIDLRNVLQKDATNARARLLLARTELALGDVAAASAYFAKVDTSQVDAVELERVRWNVRLGEHKFADVVAGLENAPARLPATERLDLLARAYLGLGRAQDARGLLEKVVHDDPAEDAARAALGWALLGSAGPVAAVTYLRQAAQERPGSLAVRRALAEVQLRAGSLPEAEDSFRAALSLADPQSDLAAYLALAAGLADALLAQGKREAVAALAATVTAVAPDSWTAVLLRGRVAAARRDFPTALENLQKLLSADPDNAQIRTMVAGVFLEQHSPEQATANLQRVLATHPEFEPARRLLAQAYISQGRAQEAARLLEEPGAAQPSPELKLLEARAALAAGDAARAMGILAQLESATGLPEQTRLDVAATYLQAGKPERALRLLGGAAGPPSARRDQIRLVVLAARDPAEGSRALEHYGRANLERRAELQFAALALAALGRFEPASALLRDYARAHPRDVAVLGSLAQTQVRAGRLDDAEATLRSALTIEPTLEARVALAQLASLRGREDEASRWLEQVRAADPKAALPRTLLARAYLAQHQPDAARPVVAELLAIDPIHVEPRLLAADLALARNDDAGALQSVNEAVHLAPDSAAAWLAKGRVHERLKQVEVARSALRHAIALAPLAPAPLGALARLELSAGDPSAALAVARHAAERSESRALGLALEGELLQQQGHAVQAVRVFEHLQSLQPSRAAAVSLYRARLQAGLASPEATLVDWLKKHPGDAVAPSVLAEYWENKGQRSRALAQYETALKAQPNSPVLLNNLAWLYAAAGDARALPTARRAYELAPLNPSVADTLGWVLVRSKQLDEGVTRLREAAARAPDSADIQYHLASALLLAGDKAGARAIAARFASASTAPDWQAKFAALAKQ